MKTLFALPSIIALSACTTDVHKTSSKPPVPQAQKAHTSIPVQPPKMTTPTKQPEELGKVSWMRDFNLAQRLAEKHNKPMFVLFTEVPGCSTVKGFAHTVLSHPQIVEAIQTQFVPVVVYNNVDGLDRQILNHFKEPTWNNPVVRIMDARQTMLTSRYQGPYDVDAMSKAMISALTTAKQTPPGYLKLLHQSARAQKRGTKRAVFSMYCFWSGETKLGAMNGVVSSRTGFAQGKEVVEVEYDPKVTTSKHLATQFGAAPMSTKAPIRPSLKDDKYQLRHSALRFVPMTSIQASHVNAALGKGQRPEPWLSPGQIELYAKVKAHPKARWPKVLMHKNFTKAWQQTTDFAQTLAHAQ